MDINHHDKAYLFRWLFSIFYIAIQSVKHDRQVESSNIGDTKLGHVQHIRVLARLEC